MYIYINIKICLFQSIAYPAVPSSYLYRSLYRSSLAVSVSMSRLNVRHVVTVLLEAHFLSTKQSIS